MSFTGAISTCMVKKFATIKGRASRAEFWWFQLFLLIIAIGWFSLIFAFTQSEDVLLPLLGIGIYGLVMIIPIFCVRVRRLHDTGHSGWWILMGLIPYVGELSLLILLCGKSNDGDNEYGPNPYDAPLDEDGHDLNQEDTKNSSLMEEQTEEVTNINI